MTDFNCFVGNWPFHALPRHSVADLAELHRQNGVSGGYVSSLESIFYNDVYESELMLHDAIRDTSYQHVITVNPAVSASANTVLRCISDFSVKGIRLHPTYHGYTMDDDSLAPIAEIARKNALPIFINARMLDERMTYMIIPPAMDFDALKRFIAKNGDIKIVLCYFREHEIGIMKEEITKNPNVYIDTTGIRGNLFGETELYKIFGKAVYGSGFPLCSMTAGAMMLRCEIEDERIKADLLSRDRI